MYDPFRVQFLTISLDSEIVLALIGVLVAGLVARDAARRLGRSPDDLLDADVNKAYWMIVGARLGWVASHFEYYARAPVQVVAVGDGGFLFRGGVFTVFWLLRQCCARLRPKLG